MKKNIIKKILLYLFWTIVGSLGIGLVLGGAFLARIQYAPLSLKDLQPGIIRSIQAITPQYKVSFNYAIVTWKGLGHPIFIHAKNVDVQDAEQKRLKVALPELQISFSIPALLIGKFSIRTLEIIKPSLRFIHENISATLKPSSETDDQFILTLIDNFLKEKQNLRKVKSIKIVQANVKIEDSKGKELLYIPSSTFTLESVDKKQKFDFTGGTELNFFQLSGTSDHKTGEIFSDLNIHSSTPNIGSLIQFQDLGSFTASYQEKFLFLQGIKVPFSFVSKFHYSEREGLKEASFILNLDQGKIDIPSVFMHPIDITKGTLEALYSDNHIQLKKLEMQSGNTHIRSSAQGTWNKGTKELTLKGKVEVDNVLLSNLNKFWPTNLAVTPRQWVIKNITQGKVPKATLELDSVIILEDSKIDFFLRNLGGQIKIQDITVSYLEGMPKVTHINGEATYSSKDFLIRLDSGNTHQLKIKSGVVDIRDLDKRNQKIDIKLNIHGSLSQHLSFIDHKPLEYAKQLALKPSQVSGEAQTFIHLEFPLLTTVTLNEIQVDINSKLFETRLLNIIEAFPCELNNGKFSLKINNQNILFEGVGHVFEVPLQVKWQKNFNFDSAFDTKLDLTGIIDEKLFKHQKINCVQDFVGAAPLEVHYMSKGKSQGILNAKIDLTNARVRILGWSKIGMTRGGIEVSMEMRNFAPYKLNFIKANVADDVYIEGKGVFDNLGLKALDFTHFKVGLTNIHFNILRQDSQRYTVKLWGRTLNLEPLWQDFLHSSKSQLGLSFELKARVNDIILGINRSIYNSNLDLHYNKGILNYLDFKAGLSQKNPKAIFKIHLSANNTHTRKIKLKTEYGGKFLKTFGIYDNVYEGNLNIIATHNDHIPQDPWHGKLVLTDFSLKKAPIMGRLLSLAFPTGMVELFSEKGLPFNHFRSKFSATSNKIVFTKGHANGTSIGLTFAGAVDLQKKNLQLHGSVIPAYYLNTILSKIPIIGEIASGGKHEGLFSVSYTISGDSNKPEITVNPVSIFTPGFFRKIFEPDIDQNFEDADEEEEYKDLND